MAANNNSLKFLDGIRGLAALYVLIHHARLLLTQPYFEGFLQHPDKYSPLSKILVYGFSLFKFGYEAVLIFFILSGFVIHLKQAENRKRTFSSPIFYKKRLIRIYPTLITSIIFTFICGIILYFLNARSLNDFTPSRFFLNLFLIPDAPIWGFNYPMWSLKHEWFFYIFYPLLYLLSKASYLTSLIPPIVLTLLFYLGIKIPIIGDVSYTILFWWLGAGLAELYVTKKNLSYFIYLVIPLAITLYFTDNKITTGLTFTCLTLCAFAYLLTRQNSYISLFLEKLKPLGDFSFSLYLLHFPLQTLIQGIYLYYYSNLPYNFTLVFAGIVIPIPIIYCIYLQTEKKAIEIKSKKFSSPI